MQCLERKSGKIVGLDIAASSFKKDNILRFVVDRFQQSFSEAQFNSLEYHPGFPSRFQNTAAAIAFC